MPNFEHGSLGQSKNAALWPYRTVRSTYCGLTGGEEGGGGGGVTGVLGVGAAAGDGGAVGVVGVAGAFWAATEVGRGRPCG